MSEGNKGDACAAVDIERRELKEAEGYEGEAWAGLGS